MGTYFRRKDPAAILFAEWSECQSQGLHYTNVLLRLYGPLQPWFDKTWKPGEFGLVR
jgi:hypothetical protein